MPYINYIKNFFPFYFKLNVENNDKSVIVHPKKSFLEKTYKKSLNIGSILLHKKFKKVRPLHCVLDSAF